RRRHSGGPRTAAMTRLELRLVVAAVLAATVVTGAVVCAAYGWTIVASVLSIYALGVGAWLGHCVERVAVARRMELPMLRWADSSRANRRLIDGGVESDDEPDR